MKCHPSPTHTLVHVLPLKKYLRLRNDTEEVKCLLCWKLLHVLKRFTREIEKKTVPQLRIYLAFAFHHPCTNTSQINMYFVIRKYILNYTHFHFAGFTHLQVSPKYEFKLYLPGGVPCCFCCSLLLESRTIEMRLIFQIKSRR